MLTKQNKFLIIFLTAAFLFSFTPAFPAPNETIIHKNYEIYFTSVPVFLDTPIIEKKSVLYAPLRNLLPELNADISYNRKTNAYTIDFKEHKKQLLFAVNNPNYSVNNKQFKFENPPMTFQTRIYIPLKNFLAIINQTIQKKEKKLFIIDLTKEKEHIPPRPISAKKIFTINKSKAKLLSFYIPKIATNKPAYILHDRKKLNITNCFIYRKGRLFIDFLPFFKANGYQYQIYQNSLSLRKNEVLYTFLGNKASVLIQKGDMVKSKKLSYRVIYKNNRFYFPLHAFAKDLGYTVRWQSKHRTFLFLNQLNNITLTKENNKYKLFIASPQILNLSPTYRLKNPNRTFWDIPNSALSFQSQTIPLKEKHLTKFSVGQHPTKTRLVIQSKTRLWASIKTIKTGTEITLSPKTLIEKKIAKPKPAVKPTVVKTPKPTKIQVDKTLKQILKNKVIAIDPGHGGFDPGALGCNREREKVYTLDISKRLQRLLKAHGARVIMARTRDINPSMYQRCQMANRNNADILISIHINSFIKSYARGIETYYYKKKDRLLSSIMHKELVRNLKLPNHGLKRAQMYMLNHIKMPGVLVEPGFITNPHDLYLIKQPQFRQKIADSIFRGTVRYFKVRG